MKKGILLIHRNGKKAYVFGAGIKFGKPGFEDYDDLKWMHGWKINKDKFVHETIFANGDIEGSKKVRIRHPGISIWNWMDGAPNTGGTLCWDGHKYLWIHEGE
ncbi:hypothetical protein [Mucilaginibacter psychrotolerans]|uniref:Uncharacterized protein n=1 Tax=Mucilaginibacter psychrotolerans TaxID=1524096 RepID=A0A4Y8S4D1_9SPHI|nr:hypothetical protein [Mucilaginibacter psychrotolerans]TFF33274.1 hypothetical protein E2R66_26715 [Mucilaginibacter psychrotolerans]